MINSGGDVRGDGGGVRGGVRVRIQWSDIRPSVGEEPRIHKPQGEGQRKRAAGRLQEEGLHRQGQRVEYRRPRWSDKHHGGGDDRDGDGGPRSFQK